MLADMILFAHLEAGYEPVVIKVDVSEGRRLFKDGKKQIFYFDDFIGETFLGQRIDFTGKREDSSIIEFLRMIAESKSGRIVLTTREHILSHAFQISDRFRSQREQLLGQKYVLDVRNYSLTERGRILYNHIYFGDLPGNYKNELIKDRFYMEVVRHRNFNPSLIEWLTRYVNVRGISAISIRSEVRRVLDNPEQLWQIAFERQISEASRSLLLALYSLAGEAQIDRLEKAWTAIHLYRSAKYNWSTAAEDWRKSLQDLELGFLAIGKDNVSFVNPSVKDFLDAKLVSDRPHLLDLMEASCFFEQVVNIWALICSNKGLDLRRFFESSPDQLHSAIIRNITSPHVVHQSTPMGTRRIVRVDVGPEVRLRTALSMALNTRPQKVLDSARHYSKQLITLWPSQSADYKDAVAILRLLDGAKWGAIRDDPMHAELTKSLLEDLIKYGDSSKIVEMISYSESPNSRFSERGQEVLSQAIDAYFDEGFNKEFADGRLQKPGWLAALALE